MFKYLNYEKYFVSKENVDWDIPYVFIVRDYNTNGNPAGFGKAYMDGQLILVSTLESGAAKALFH